MKLKSKLIRTFNRFGFNEYTHFSHAGTKNNNYELEFADQMAYSEFTPDWIVKESQIFKETRSIRGMLLYAPDSSEGFPLEIILVVRL